MSYQTMLTAGISSEIYQIMSYFFCARINFSIDLMKLLVFFHIFRFWQEDIFELNKDL